MMVIMASLRRNNNLKSQNSLIVKLQGGLGNQLFQYAFYKNLESLSRNVILDIRWFNKSTNRPLKIFDAFDMPEITLKSGIKSTYEWFLKNEVRV